MVWIIISSLEKNIQRKTYSARKVVSTDGLGLLGALAWAGGGEPGVPGRLAGYAATREVAWGTGSAESEMYRSILGREFSAF